MLRTFALSLATTLSLLAAAPAHAQTILNNGDVALLFIGDWKADVDFDTTAFAETLPDDVYRCAEGEVELPDDVTVARFWYDRSEIWTILRAAAAGEQELLASWDSRSEEWAYGFTDAAAKDPAFQSVDDWATYDPTWTAFEVDVEPLEVADGVLTVEICDL